MRRTAAAALALGACAIGWAAWSSRSAAAAPAVPPPPDNPVDELTMVSVMALLDENQPLRLAISGTIPEPRHGTEVKLFYATQQHYPGQLTEPRVRALIERGAAASLEHRLTERAATDLREHLAELDQGLRDLCLLIDETEQEIRTSLRGRPDRQITITTKPREQDPLYPELWRALNASETCSVWGEPSSQGERHLVVRWDEWPELETMYDDRSRLLIDRTNRARSWIEAAFAAHAMKILVAP